MGGFLAPSGEILVAAILVEIVVSRWMCDHNQLVTTGWSVLMANHSNLKPGDVARCDEIGIE